MLWLIGIIIVLNALPLTVVFLSVVCETWEEGTKTEAGIMGARTQEHIEFFHGHVVYTFQREGRWFAEVRLCGKTSYVEAAAEAELRESTRALIEHEQRVNKR